MNSRLIIDGNAVYEIDEDCLRKRKEQEQKKRERAGRTWFQEAGKENRTE